jgi:hypothetical protein
MKLQTEKKKLKKLEREKKNITKRSQHHISETLEEKFRVIFLVLLIKIRLIYSSLIDIPIRSNVCCLLTRTGIVKSVQVYFRIVY